MAIKTTPIINILTYKLPFDLANQIYNEYQQRHREAIYILEHSKKFKEMRKDLKMIETLLAVSIFHKRVVSSFDGAIGFYRRVTKNSSAETIKIGTFSFTVEERNMLLGIVMNYNQLMERFQIQPFVMEYYLTREFLDNVWKLKMNLSNGKSNKPKTDQSGEEDLPF